MSLKSEFKIMIIQNKTVTCACECSDKQAHIATELTIETIREIIMVSTTNTITNITNHQLSKSLKKISCWF